MSEKEILCDRNNMYLIKKYDENEDDIYEIYYKCEFDETSNIFKIIDNNGFENLLFELNKDLISSVDIKNENIYFKIKNTDNKNTDNKNNDIFLNLKILNYTKNKNIIEITYINSNDSKKSILVDYIKYSFELKKNILYFNILYKFKEDQEIDFHVVMFIIKKSFYRLKKYTELKL